MYTVCFICILISCRENTNEPTGEIKSNDLFQIKENCSWQYSNNEGKELSLQVINRTDSLWVNSFFDTTEKMTYPTSIIRARYISSGFPKTEYWAYGVTESSILFGQSQHSLVKKYENVPAPYFFQILELNKSNLKDTVIVRDTIIDKYGKVYRNLDSTVIYDSYISETDSIPSVWKIKYFAKRVGYENGSILMEFELTDNRKFSLFLVK